MTTSRRLWPTALACVLPAALACSGGGDQAEPPVAPRGARETVAFVNDAVAGEYGDPSAETAQVFAGVGADHLDDFARDDLTDEPARLADGHVAIGSVPAARFLALAMATPEGRGQIYDAHATTALDVAVTGLTTEQSGRPSDWEDQLGKLDAIVTAGTVLGRDLPDSEAAAVSARAQDAQERAIAAAHLVVALRAEADGVDDPALASIVDVARSTMSADAVAEVRAGVTGRYDEAVRPGLPASIHADLAADFDQLRQAFAGHEEYPVEAAMFSVFRAYDAHLGAALDPDRQADGRGDRPGDG